MRAPGGQRGGWGLGASEALPAEWSVRWPFSPDDPTAFGSTLRVTVWSSDGDCAVTTTYEGRLPACPGYPYDPNTPDPCTGDPILLAPEVARDCPD